MMRPFNARTLILPRGATLSSLGSSGLRWLRTSEPSFSPPLSVSARQGSVPALQLLVVGQPIVVRVIFAVILADDQLAAPLPLVGHAVIVRIAGSATLLTASWVDLWPVNPETAVPFPHQRIQPDWPDL